MRGFRTVVAVLLSGFALVGLAGCGGGAPAQLAAQEARVVGGPASIADEIARAIRTLRAGSDDIVRLPGLPQRPIPRAELPQLATAVGNEVAALVAPHVGDLSASDARQLLKYACIANDYYELGSAKTFQDAAVKAAGQTPGRIGYHARVAGLAMDVNKAKSSSSFALAVGTYVACEKATGKL